MANIAPMRCGATNRKGGTCQQPAGYGTDHPGAGRCKWHGGSAPNGRKQGARELAVIEAKKMLGQDVEGDPTTVILEGVRLSRGITAYLRALIAAHEGEVPEHIEKAYAEAVERQVNMAAKASAAHVDERMVRLAERFADSITLVVEEAVAGFADRKGVDVSTEDRLWLAGVVQAGLSRHEQQPVIEGREA